MKLFFIEKNELKTKQILFVFFGILGFAYIALRSYFIEITHDEANSFYLLHINYWKAIVGTANTHLLNSFFMKIFMIIFGNQVWMLRIHSVLAFIIFTVFLFKIAKKFLSLSASIALIAIFLLNPYCLEYFSLARGYGLSLAFFCAMIFYAFTALTEIQTNTKTVFVAFVFGGLSLLSSFTALFQFALIALFLFAFIGIKNSNIRIIFRKPWRKLVLLFLAIVVFSAANLLLYMLLSDDLHYGGDTAFITDSLGSMMHYWFYFLKLPLGNKVHISELSFLSYSWFLLLIGFGVFGIIKKIKTISILFFVFFTSFVASNVVFYLFATPFPFGRTAISLFAILAFLMIFSFDAIVKSSFFKIILASVFLALSIFNFVQSANLSSSYEWPMQSRVEEAFELIINDAKQSKIEHPKLLMDGYVFAVWKNYYSQINPKKYNFEAKLIEKEINYSDSLEVDELIKNQNYLLLTPRFYNQKLDERSDFKAFYYFEVSGLRIFKNNSALNP